MDKLFIIKLILSFFIAGIWISTATFIAEKAGSKIGGLITNLPSNILISLIFVSLYKGNVYTAESTAGVPIGMAINTIFVFVYVLVLARGVIWAPVLALLAWLLSALLFAQLHLFNFIINAAIYFLITIAAFLILEYYFKIPAVPKSTKKYSSLQLLLRALFAGTIVATVIASAQILPPYLFGIFSTFPAVLLSTMLILVYNQGSDFARATGKILVLSSSNIIIYALVVKLTFVSLGMIWGTLLAFCAALLWIAALRPLLNKIQ